MNLISRPLFATSDAWAGCGKEDHKDNEDDNEARIACVGRYVQVTLFVVQNPKLLTQVAKL